MPLHYHNGYIQIARDETIAKQISEPFWRLVSTEKWSNISTDVAEAIDRRDAGRRDSAFYAAKALESTIKIISDDKGWTKGTEKGAAQYVDNLVVARNGMRFIEVWEKEFLVSFFKELRNPFVHGPGSATMPELSPQQTDWAIENAMSWCKSLIQRL